MAPAARDPAGGAASASPPHANESAPAPGAAQPFGDRVARHVAARRSQLVLGLDPDPLRLWPRALERAESHEARAEPLERAESHEARAAGHEARAAPHERPPGAPAERAARAVAAHCRLVLEATAEHCVAVKLQVACFERLGAPGWAALQAAADAGREHGLLVIADAKRGDIDVSAAAYAEAFLGGTPTPYGRVDGLGADALTANPLLGRDSLAPLVRAARERPSGAGVFVLVRTSNPGAADVQERSLGDGGTVSEHLARLVAELGADQIGADGLSDIGAVVGATAPARLQRMRELMPHTIFLLPGVGAQGGRIDQLAPAFAPGPAGGLVSVSRGIVAAHERTGGDPAAAARSEAQKLRELAWRVAG